MRILFMGNPAFSVPTLSLLHKLQHNIVSVLTNPDKPQGRGRKLRSTPVADFSRKNNIPLIQPVSLKSAELADKLETLNIDLFIVVAFRILPKIMLQIPHLGSINLHGSLLPKYRGAAPIQWSLINGDSVTGVSTFFLKPKVDTGNVILQRKVVIYPEDDYGSLANRMSSIGATAVIETLQLIEHGNYPAEIQDENLVTKAPKITPEICQVDWTKSAFEIHNLVRALSPAPAAFTMLNGRRLKIFKTRLDGSSPSEPGKIVEKDKRLVLSCGKECLEILELQIEGKRRMFAEQFMLGANLNSGTIFG